MHNLISILKEEFDERQSNMKKSKRKFNIRKSQDDSINDITVPSDAIPEKEAVSSF